MNFEQRVREDLLTYLAGRQEIDVPMPECPDVEEAWRKVGEDYMPDGIREFNAYPTVSLGWIMFVGMAMAQLWDTDWQRADVDAHIYIIPCATCAASIIPTTISSTRCSVSMPKPMAP